MIAAGMALFNTVFAAAAFVVRHGQDDPESGHGRRS